MSLIKRKKDDVKIVIDLKRINKFNLILICLIAFTLVLTRIIEKRSFNTNVILIATAVIAIIIYYIPFPQIFKSITLPLMPAIANILSAYLENGSLTYFIILFASLIMSALYYKQNILIINTVLTNIFTVILVLVVKNGLISPEMPVNAAIISMIRMDLTVFILFIMTRWGYEYIYKATKAKYELDGIFEKLKHVIDSAKETTVSLEADVNKTSYNLNNLSTSSKNLIDTTSHMASGASEQSQSANLVSDLTSASLEKMVKIQNISGKVSDTSISMVNTINDSSKKVMLMNDKMRTIHQGIDITVDTVTELQRNMGEIINLLDAISGIASQTNMLALNASIEAARAGEAGKGFAVVAEEVRKLSYETDKTAGNISKILNKLNNSAEITLERVCDVKSTVEHGNQIMTDLDSSFRLMNSQFSNMDKIIHEENQYITQMSSDFNSIMDKIQTIASIAIDNAAASEEIYATIEDQHANLENINKQMSSIQNSSNSLKERITA